MLANFFIEGGPGMLLISIAGLVLISLSVRYLLSPDPRRHQPLLLTGLLTLALGALGTVLGCVGTLHAVHQVEPKDQLVLMAAGLAESLNNLLLSLLFVVLMLVLTAVGSRRLAQQEA